MWQCCCGIGVTKTWKILQRTWDQHGVTGPTQLKNRIFLYWFFLLTIGVGPELTLIRAFLWSRLTIEERNVGTISEVLFPLWPFFIIPAVCIPAYLSRLLSNENGHIAVSSLPYHCLMGGGFVSSIVFYVLKFDGMFEISMLNCSIPLFISSAMLCLYGVFNLCNEGAIFHQHPSYCWSSGFVPIVCCFVPIIMTVVSLLIIKYDDDNIFISLYIFPAIVSGLVFCGCCSLVGIFSLSGWGSS